MLEPVTENATTKDLLDACRRGDRSAMRSIYTEHHARVFSVALNYFGGRRETAEDVTHRVFVKLFSGVSFRGDAEFTTWLYRVTINMCTDEARRSMRFVELKGLFGISGERTASVQQLMAESRELSEAVQAAIARLRPKLRLPILLKYSGGLSYQEIADVLGCSIGTVSSRMNRGHKALAAKLGHLRSEL